MILKMKTLHLFVIFTTVLLVPILMNNHALGGCLVGNDWPNAPCYGCPGCIPSKEKQREEWNPYYQYKGASWMEMMKTQMIGAMKNGTLEDWVSGNQSNYDAWRYYYLNDQAPFFRSSVSGLNDEPHYIPPPLQQLKTGIESKDIACKVGLELMIKTGDGLPVCVRYPTANVLLERGWAKETISTMTSPETTVIIPVNSSIRSNGFTFTPSVVKVVIGTNNTVRWINMDSVTNDITSSSVSFRSGLIESGYAWTHTFDKSGIYRYYSDIHTWLKGTVIVENNTSSQKISNSDQQAKLLSENDCGKFYTVPENHTSLNTVPVLLMKTNSTACAKLTFTIISNYNDCNGPNCQHVLDVKPTGLIGNLHYEKHGGSFSITPGKDYTNSFKIVTIPSTVDLANYPIGTNYTVTYIIKPLANATGFYDQSIPRLACERYPLAVGYAADQVNASDFSYIDTLNPSCVSEAYGLTKVEVSGMDYKEVTLRLAVLEQVK